AVAVGLIGSKQAWRHKSHPDCSANNFHLDIAKTPPPNTEDNVTSGFTATIISTVTQVADSTTCDITLVNGVILFCSAADGTPTGTQTVLIAPGTTIPGGTAGFGPVFFTNKCLINLNPGVKTATFRV